jgi:hypothetical protein
VIKIERQDIITINQEIKYRMSKTKRENVEEIVEKASNHSPPAVLERKYTRRYKNKIVTEQVGGDTSGYHVISRGEEARKRLREKLVVKRGLEQEERLRKLKGLCEELMREIDGDVSVE